MRMSRVIKMFIPKPKDASLPKTAAIRARREITASDDARPLPNPSCRRRPASMTCLRAASEVVDAGMRRHDGTGRSRAAKRFGYLASGPKQGASRTQGMAQGARDQGDKEYSPHLTSPQPCVPLGALLPAARRTSSHSAGL